MTGSGRKQQKADALVVAVSEGRSIRDAAELAGMSERSAYRVLNRPEVQARIEQLRQEAFSRASSHLSGLSIRAARKLGDLLEEADRTVSLRAAKIILEGGAKLRETVSLEGRIAEIEAAVAAQKQRRK